MSKRNDNSPLPRPMRGASRRPAAARRRRGAILLEVVVSAVVLCGLLVLAAQTMVWTARARRAVDERALALIEAANLLDEIASLPWSELNAERLSARKLSPDIAKSLPAASLKVFLKDSPSEELPASKRVTVAITWQDPSGLDRKPVRLTAWAYPAEEK